MGLSISAALKSPAIKEINSGVAQLGSQKPSSSFKELLSKSDLLGSGAHREMIAFEKQLLSNKKISPRELLMLQMRVGNYGLRIEMVSKLAEAGVAGLRKFEQNS